MMKKVWFVALAAGLAGLMGGASSIAEAQWAPQRAPSAAYGYNYDPLGASREQLAAAAHAMSESSEHVAHFLRATDGLSYLTDDALALARSAEMFHQMVESGAPLPQLVSDFNGMSREFQMLARAVEGAHDVHHGGHFQQDWAELRNSYMTTAQIMQQASTAQPRRFRRRFHAYTYAPAPYYQPAPAHRAGWQVRVGF